MWPHNDYYRIGEALRDIEREYGLRVLARADRTAAQVADPGRDGKVRPVRAAEPPRVVLHRHVRAAAAAARSEEEFFAGLAARGVLVRLRHSAVRPGRGHRLRRRPGATARSRPPGLVQRREARGRPDLAQAAAPVGRAAPDRGRGMGRTRPPGPCWPARRCGPRRAARSEPEFFAAPGGGRAAGPAAGRPGPARPPGRVRGHPARPGRPGRAAGVVRRAARWTTATLALRAAAPGGGPGSPAPARPGGCSPGPTPREIFSLRGPAAAEAARELAAAAGPGRPPTSPGPPPTC